MSIFRTLIMRTNRAKRLTTFIKQSSVPQIRNQTTCSFQIKNWLKLVAAWTVPIDIWRDLVTWIDSYKVPADLQGNINGVLPEELSRTVVKLECESSVEGGICEVYVVGTCHISQKSSEEVKAIIGILKPQVVFVELCLRRINALFPQKSEVPTMRDMVTRWWKYDKPFALICLNWLFTKRASQLGVGYGAEFCVAFEEAIKNGSKLVLGDRSTDMRSILLGTQMRSILDQLRDQYMSAGLLKVAREHSIVVAVVGLGHLEGIKRYWKQPNELELELELINMELVGNGKPVELPIEIIAVVPTQ